LALDGFKGERKICVNLRLGKKNSEEFTASWGGERFRVEFKKRKLKCGHERATLRRRRGKDDSSELD